MESGLAVRGFIDFGRVVDISVRVKVVNDFVDGKVLLIFIKEGLLGRNNQVSDPFLFLVQILVKRQHIGPERDILKFVVFGHDVIYISKNSR